MSWSTLEEKEPAWCLREIQRISREVEERRITPTEGWNRVNLIFLRVGNSILSNYEPVV